MEPSIVKNYYRQKAVVAEYALAANNVGLWESEEKICKIAFPKDRPIIELGCGAGRIGFGLHEIGFRKLTLTDYSSEMIKEARRIAKVLSYDLTIEVADATALPYPDGSFAGAIFGFNGLMQIPKTANRQLALGEISRILEKDAPFLFTTHDRDNPKHKKYWKAETRRWKRDEQQQELDEFGDIYRPTDHGCLYIHSPTLKEIRQMLRSAGFRVEFDKKRSEIALEPQRVREFSDDCRFWLARKKYPPQKPGPNKQP